MDNPFFIRLESKKKIEMELIKEWLTDIKGSLPITVFGSVIKTMPDKTEKRGSLSHRTSKNGTHLYEIPLTRDLTVLEKEAVEKASYWIIKATKSYLSFNGKGLTSYDTSKQYSLQYQQLCVDIAKMMHQKWYHEKSNDGWRYGLSFNMKDKTHPMMRPWEDLPESYRKVDYDLPKEILQIFINNGFVMINKFDLDNLMNK